MQITPSQEALKNLLAEIRRRYTVASSSAEDKNMQSALIDTIDKMLYHNVADNILPTPGLEEEILHKIDIEIRVLKARKDAIKNELGKEALLMSMQLRYQIKYLEELRGPFERIRIQKESEEFDMKIAAKRNAYKTDQDNAINALFDECLKSLSKVPGYDSYLHLDDMEKLSEDVDYIRRYYEDPKAREVAKDYLPRLRVKYEAEKSIEKSTKFISYLKLAMNNNGLLLEYLRILNKGDVAPVEQQKQNLEDQIDSMNAITSFFNQAQKRDLQAKANNLGEKVEDIKTSKMRLSEVEEKLMAAGLGPVIKSMKEMPEHDRTIEDQVARFIRFNMNAKFGIISDVTNNQIALEKQNIEKQKNILTRIDENLKKYNILHFKKDDPELIRFVGSLSYEQLNFIEQLENYPVKGCSSPMLAVDVIEALGLIHKSGITKNEEEVESLGIEYDFNESKKKNIEEIKKICIGFVKEKEAIMEAVQTGIDEKKLKGINFVVTERERQEGRAV